MLTRWSDFDHILGWPDYRSTLGTMEQFRRQLGKLFEEWESPTPFGVTTWPRTNLYDAGNELVVTAEVPGMTNKDVEVTVHQNILTLSGKREEKVPEGYSVHRQEREAVSFSRSFSVPCKVDLERASASVKDGVLSITLPKAPEAQPRQITVKAR